MDRPMVDQGARRRKRFAPTGSSAVLSAARLVERIAQLARLHLGRRHDYLRAGLLELLEAAALDALELDLQHVRARPLAVGRELDVADHGLEGRGVDVVG